MGTSAVVMGDKVMGTCAVHQIPNPASGAPQPAPPMLFSAPLLQGLVSNVLITGKAAAVVGSTGYNTPPHVGLHASDPYLVPTTQEGRVVVGSLTVLIGGKQAAKTGCQVTICASVAGTITGSASTVLIGG